MTDTAYPFPSSLLGALARNWWLTLLRGIAAIAFGILTFIWPGVTLVSLVLLYGAFAFVNGVLALWAGIAGRTPAPQWWLILVCLLRIAAGLLTAVPRRTP